MKDWVLSHLNLHCPPSKTDCEACPGGSSDSRINLYRPGFFQPIRPPCPFPPRLPSGQWLRQVSSPITAAWPSPIPTGFPSDSGHLNTDRIFTFYHKIGGDVNFGLTSDRRETDEGTSPHVGKEKRQNDKEKRR